MQEVQETGLLIDGRDYYRAFYHAARMAQRYILIAGWQFDSTVRLLRGEDVEEGNDEVCFLPFLDGLCKKNPELRVYILAWDFHLIYALEREWWQRYIFKWTTNRQMQFHFDNCHPLGASHHQKFVVIDRHIAFVGGADICASRWDDRDHRVMHPERLREGDTKPYGPYHEIQSYHVGPVAQQLTELFAMRWRQSGGATLELFPSPPVCRTLMKPTVAIAAAQVALSRTHPPMLFPPQAGVHEISHLYLDAIAAADKIIYIENQYFSSEAIYNALVERMRAHDRSRLQIIMILPKRPEAFLEEIAMGFVQAKMLRALADIACETGHAFGVYYAATSGEDGKETPTYIHSKLLLVDDCFMTVGSANTTNRSMGVDTELNVSWEASSYRQRPLIRTIRHTRMSLLAEHSGVDLQKEKRNLGRIRGLVDYLNRLASSGFSRLHYHPMDTSFDESEWLRVLKPKNLALDPKRPLFTKEPDKQHFSYLLRVAQKILVLSSSLTASSAVYFTQERLDPFTQELMNLDTLGNLYHLRLVGRLPWSLVLAGALLAALFWW